MTTGPMRDCVSIIVLWDFAGGNAANVRGYHGWGGLGMVDMANLFAGVPNDPNTVVRCIFGSLAQLSSDPANAPGEVGSHVQFATVTYHNHANAQVDRAGAVTPA